MAKIFFLKLAFNAPIKLKDAFIRFEPVGNNAGVKVLEDNVASQAEELAFLNQLADTKARGVSRISESLYNEKKNNRASATSQSRQSGFGSIRILEPRDSSPLKASAAQPAAAQAARSAAESAVSNLVSKIPVVPEAGPQSEFTPAVRKRTSGITG